MADVSLYAVDASAALKWRFQEEPSSQQAVDLITDYETGRVNLIAPPHFPFEIANAVRRRVLDRKMDRITGARTVEQFLALRIPTVHPIGLERLAYDFSFRFSTSLYDAL